MRWSSNLCRRMLSPARDRAPCVPGHRVRSLADPSIVLIVLGAVAGGLVQGLSGFAFGLIAMAFWAWAVPPQLAAPMVVFGSLLGQLLALGTIRTGLAA